MKHKGIILAGGVGRRLGPITLAVNKHFLPVFDKPMIYYPLCTLMSIGVRDILIISTPQDIPRFVQLLADGNRWGINIHYAVQSAPNGIAQAITIAENFIDNHPSILILGDNIFHGPALTTSFKKATQQALGVSLWLRQENQPSDFCVAEIGDSQRIISLEEKPAAPKSNYIVTGIYFYDNQVIDLVKIIKPSPRNEYEITDLNNLYLKMDQATFNMVDLDQIWFDMGTSENLLRAGQTVKEYEQHLKQKMGCPEEIAYRNQWINANELGVLAHLQGKSRYGQYLLNLITK